MLILVHPMAIQRSYGIGRIRPAVQPGHAGFDAEQIIAYQAPFLGRKGPRESASALFERRHRADTRTTANSAPTIPTPCTLDIFSFSNTRAKITVLAG